MSLRIQESDFSSSIARHRRLLVDCAVEDQNATEIIQRAESVMASTQVASDLATPFFYSASTSWSTTTLVINTARQIGALASNVSGSGVHSFSGSSEGEIVLCRSHKIKQEDLQRMAGKVQQTELLLAEAEQKKHQAIENYKAIFARTLNHAEVSIGTSGTGGSIHDPGDLFTYDFPALRRLKFEEQNACSEYNTRLCQYAHEKSLYGEMQRAFDRQDKPGFWGIIWDGTRRGFGVVLEIFRFGF